MEFIFSAGGKKMENPINVLFIYLFLTSDMLLSLSILEDLL